MSYLYTYIPSLLDLPPMPLGHHRAQSRGPCAVEQFLASFHFTMVVDTCQRYSLNLTPSFSLFFCLVKFSNHHALTRKKKIHSLPLRETQNLQLSPSMI